MCFPEIPDYVKDFGGQHGPFHNCFEAAGMPVAAAKTAGMLAAQALTVDPTPP